MRVRSGGLRPYTADAVAPESRRRLRALAAALPAALLGALILAPAASAGWFLPESAGSPNADAIRTLYILIALIGLVIFVGVEGLLIYSLIRFRARKGRVAAQIHGNTQLEIGWTVGAAAILIFLTVFTFVLLGDIKDPAASQIDSEGNPIASNATFAALDQSAPPEGSAAMTIKVVGEQYAWSYFYPAEEGSGRVFAYNDMYVPIGMTVILEIQAKDVAHSWWIPALGGKADAIPGYTNKTWFQIPLDALEEGEDRVIYEGQCAELCGRNHANMRATVRAVTPQEYERYIEGRKLATRQANEAAAEQRQDEEGALPQGPDAPQATP